MSYCLRDKQKVEYYSDQSRYIEKIKKGQHPEERILWLDHPHITLEGYFHEKGRIFQFNDEYDFKIISILAFRVFKSVEQLVCNALTIQGIAYKIIINKSSVNFQIWIGAVVGIESRLKTIGFTNDDELKMLKLPSSYRAEHAKCTKGYVILLNFCKGCAKDPCECVFEYHSVKIQITKVSPDIYICQRNLEYKYRTWLQNIPGAWCNNSLMSIRKPEEGKYPYDIDFFYCDIRKALKCGMDVDRITFIKPQSEWPLDCQKESLMYCKSNEYKQCKDEIQIFLNGNNNDAININKRICIQLIGRLIGKLSCIKPPNSYVVQVITKNIKKDVILLSEYIASLLHDFGLKQLLLQYHIISNYGQDDIKFDIPLETLNKWNIDSKIKMFNDRKHLQIVSSTVKFRIIRKDNLLMIHKCDVQAK